MQCNKWVEQLYNQKILWIEGVLVKSLRKQHSELLQYRLCSRHDSTTLRFISHSVSLFQSGYEPTDRVRLHRQHLRRGKMRDSRDEWCRHVPDRQRGESLLWFPRQAAWPQQCHRHRQLRWADWLHRATPEGPRIHLHELQPGRVEVSLKMASLYS